MLKRLAYLGLLSLSLISSSGCRCICCVHDCWLASYKSSHWCSCGCGETYYDAWHNYPPDCCDPCDDYGNYTGRRWWVPSFGCCSGKSGCGCGGGGCYSGGCCGGGGGMGPAMYDEGMDMNGGTIIQGEEVPMPRQMHSAPRTGVPTPATPQQMGRRPRSNSPSQQNPRMSRRNVSYQSHMPMPRNARRASPVMDEDAESGPMLGQAVDVFDEMDAMDGRPQLTQRSRPMTSQRRRM